MEFPFAWRLRFEIYEGEEARRAASLDAGSDVLEGRYALIRITQAEVTTDVVLHGGFLDHVIDSLTRIRDGVPLSCNPETTYKGVLITDKDPVSSLREEAA